MRGNFVRADSVQIPNSLTVEAASAILRMAMRDTQNIELFAGLCRGAPEPYLDLNQLTEPTIGVNGYGRIPIPRSNSGWPVLDLLADEAYLESRQLTWTATATGFDQPVDRVFICFDESALEGPVFALSGLLPSLIRVKPETPLVERRFKYQLFLR